MIFVTVGTHEQQFNRVVEYIDKLKEKNVITEEVFIQTGFSDYKPKNCNYNNFLSYKEMMNYMLDARIVITHGGPASFLMPLQLKKNPIVIPRQKKYEEHINDHQVEFVQNVSERFKNIIPVYEIDELEKIIINYENNIKQLSSNFNSNNDFFCNELEKNIKEIM